MPFEFERTMKTWRRRRADYRLFRELCDAHQLASRQRHLLTALADRYRLVRLSEIFVRPSLYITSPDRGTWSNAEIRDLKSLLFAPAGTAPETIGTKIDPPTTPTPADQTFDSEAPLVRETIEDPAIKGVIPTTRE